MKEVCYAKAYLKAITAMLTDMEIRDTFDLNIQRIEADLDSLEQAIHRRLPSNLVPTTAVAVGHLP
jgi:hypothetical protein